VKAFLIRYFENNSKEILLITILILIGVVSSVIYTNNLSDKDKLDSGTYVENMRTYLKEKNDYTKKEKSKLLKELLFKNVSYIFVLFILGTSIIGFPIMCMFILYKNFTTGYLMSIVIAKLGTVKGIIFICFSIGIHNIIYLTSVYIMSISSISLIKTIIKDKKYYKELKYSIIEHCVFLLISLILIISASFIEVYISNYFLVMIKNYI